MSRKSHLATVRKKYEQALEFFGQEPDNSADQLMVAICLTQLDRYPEARCNFRSALRNSLKDQFWYRTNQPNWLVDTYSLADEPSFYSQVQREVKAFVLDRGGKSLVELYASALVHLLADRDEEAKGHVSGLLKKPKVKDTFAMGQAIQAIVERDQAAFDVAFDNLLEAHRGMAKFGGLRETPEGFLCLPAMSLAKIARKRGMNVAFESEYLSKEYLDYLFQH